MDIGTRCDKSRIVQCMRCPYCGSKQTDVVETRDSDDLGSIRRRRSCNGCTKRFTTHERVEDSHLFVIKKDGRREQFARSKIKNGILQACEKTTVGLATIERIVHELERELRSRGISEIGSREIGHLVAEKLKKEDKVAYIRFASVFKRFVDIEDFEKEVKRLIA